MGDTTHAICHCLGENNIPTVCGNKKWSESTISSILSNEKYKGDALLQKSFTTNFLTKRMKKNEGELPQYYVKGGHEPIVSPVVFDLVQTEIQRRKDLCKSYSCTADFSTVLICGCCGKQYGRRYLHSNDKYRAEFWRCCKYYNGDNHSPTVRDEIVRAGWNESLRWILSKYHFVMDTCIDLMSEVFPTRNRKGLIKSVSSIWKSENEQPFDKVLLRGITDRIVVEKDKTLKFYFIDGNEFSVFSDNTTKNKKERF